MIVICSIAFLLLRISNGQPVGVHDREYVSCVLSESVVLTVNMTSLILAVNASIDTIPLQIEEKNEKHTLRSNKIPVNFN